jgi:hypothetical protein
MLLMKKLMRLPSYKDDPDICNACDQRFCGDCEYGPWGEKKMMIKNIIAWAAIVVVFVFCYLMTINAIADWIVK